jgi:RNA-binding protein
MSPPQLSGNQRRFLRALAHPLDPVLQIGHQGTTPAVLAQLDEALVAHELVKVRLGRECPDSVADAASAMEAGSGAAVVQTIGRTVVVYRPHPKRPTLVLPSPRAPRAASRAAAAAKPAPTPPKPAKRPRRRPAPRPRRKHTPKR